MLANAETHSEHGPRAGWIERWAPLVAFAWPIVFFVDRLVPWRGTIRATGNDFYYLYFAYKIYLLDHLASLRLPLWSPAEGAGYPFYASPFTQTFYPLNLPLTAFYWLVGGYSGHDHQVFVALGSALFSLGCFLWLRSLGNGVAAALFGACLVATSFRMADILRFPNAVHTAAWYPWILLSFNRVFAATRRAELTRWLAALAFSSLAFLTAGYLYYVYYSLFLFGPYIAIAIGGTRGIPAPSWRRLALATGTGALCLTACAPYLVKVKQTLDATAGRDVARELPSYAFGWADALDSLVFPLGASPEGCLYVGIAGLLLVASYAQGALRVPGSERRLCAVLLCWFSIVTWISLGPGSSLHTILGGLLPGFSRLRVWGRLGIVLLLVLAWLLARAFESFQERVRTSAPKPVARWLLLATFGLVLAVQAARLLAGGIHPYYRIHMPELAGLAVWNVAGAALGVAVVLGIVQVGRRGRTLAPATMLALLLAASAADVWPAASRLWSERAPLPPRRRLDVARVMTQSLAVPRRPRTGTLPLDYDPARPDARLSPSFNLAVIPEWYFARYWRFLAATSDESLERDVLLGVVDGRRLFLSARADHVRVRSFLQDSASFGGSLSVLEYTGDRLHLAVEVPRDGFVTFVDNWDPDWRVLVDGRPAPIAVPFGTFKAAPLPAGSHQAVFEYAPWLAPSGPLTAQTSTESRVSR